jgi:hypothetical protein
MAQDDKTKNSDARSEQPTWKEISGFISGQAENDRKVIDYWFKLAAKLIGIVLVIAGVAIGFLGWKTISDAKASAEAAAREAAKAKVEEVLKQPDVQKLVRETASDLFEKGAFKKEIEGKVRELISAEVTSQAFHRLVSDAVKGELTIKTAPRVLTESQVKTIADSLRSAPEGKVAIRTGTLPEQQGYARKLFSAIQASPSWKAHVSYAEPGTWAGLENNMNLLLDGIVVVVNDVKTAPDFARVLERALKNAGIVNVRLGPCNCPDPPKPPDIWLYVGENNY